MLLSLVKTWDLSPEWLHFTSHLVLAWIRNPYTTWTRLNSASAFLLIYSQWKQSALLHPSCAGTARARGQIISSVCFGSGLLGQQQVHKGRLCDIIGIIQKEADIINDKALDRRKVPSFLSSMWGNEAEVYPSKEQLIWGMGGGDMISLIVVNSSFPSGSFFCYLKARSMRV